MRKDHLIEVLCCSSLKIKKLENLKNYPEGWILLIIYKYIYGMFYDKTGFVVGEFESLQIQSIGREVLWLLICSVLKFLLYPLLKYSCANYMHIFPLDSRQ